MRTIYSLIYTLRQEFGDLTPDESPVTQRKAETIRQVNEAAQQYFVGNVQTLKQMEMIETPLRENTEIVTTEHGIRPTLLLESLPVSLTTEPINGHEIKRPA